MRHQMKYDEQLRVLFEYTKFHIGLYTGLVTLFLALLALGGNMIPYLLYLWAKTSVVLIMLAGACGGMVASSIPNHTTYVYYLKEELGWPVAGFIKARAETWINMEHLFFWASILVVLVAMISHVFTIST